MRSSNEQAKTFRGAVEKYDDGLHSASKRKALSVLGVGMISAIATTSCSNITSSNGRNYFVDDYGASGRGDESDQKSIQRAIDQAHQSGGGRVALSPGKTYLSGVLHLKSNVELHIPAGATLKMSPNKADFWDEGALLFAKKSTNVAITGGGTIHGSDTSFVPRLPNGEFKHLPEFFGRYNFRGFDGEMRGRPRPVLFVKCSKVAIENVRIERSPTWTIHLLGCEDVTIDNIEIDNNIRIPNTDGIDIDHCRLVRVKNCRIKAGDDGVCVKTTPYDDVIMPSEAIVIENCTIQSWSSGIKFGSEGRSPIRNVLIRGCIITDSNRGVGIQNRDGSVFENIIATDLIIQTAYRPRKWWGASEPIYITNIPRRNDQYSPGLVRNIQFSNIVCHSESGAFVHGSQGGEIEHLTMSNIQLHIRKSGPHSGGFHDLRPSEKYPDTTPGKISGMHIEGVNGGTIRDIKVSFADNLPDYYAHALYVDRTKGLNINGVYGDAAHPGVEAIRRIDA